MLLGVDHRTVYDPKHLFSRPVSIDLYFSEVIDNRSRFINAKALCLAI